MIATIVIATCGRPERLAESLRCIGQAVAASGQPHRIVVVDNGPGYPAERVVRAFERPDGPVVEYVQSPPRNKARALNAGIRHADTEWVAFTDDDTRVDEFWLKNASAFAETTECRMFGGRVISGRPEQPLPAWAESRQRTAAVGHGIFVRYEPMDHDGTLSSDMTVPYGANVFVERSLFSACGGYDETLWDVCGPAALGAEDTEFGLRVRATDETIGYCHQATVVHPVHHDRCRLRVQLRLSFYYGWRAPLCSSSPTVPSFLCTS